MLVLFLILCVFLVNGKLNILFLFLYFEESKLYLYFFKKYCVLNIFVCVFEKENIKFRRIMFIVYIKEIFIIVIF